MGLNKRLLGGISSGPADTAFFKTVTYTGNWNGSNTNTITVGFQPDFIAIKCRSHSDSHHDYDSTRGMGKPLYFDSTAAESSASDHLDVTSTGFTLTTDNVNQSGRTFVAWCWKANGGTTSSNTNGSTTSTVQASSGSGFSIVKYTGTGSNATIGHGLSTAPDWIIMKNMDRAGYGWLVYHQAISEENYLVLNTTAAQQDQASIFNDTAPTSSVFSVGTDTFGNYNGDDYIAYCWHDVAGFSSFGSYTGSGSSGNAQNVGFEPDFLMFRRYNNSDNWVMVDTTRGEDKYLLGDTNGTEQSLDILDFTSTGWTFKGSSMNNSSDNFLYAAFKTTH